MDVDRAGDLVARPRAVTDQQAGPCRLRVTEGNGGRNGTARAYGAVPMHAAAFDLDGLGVLVTGWSRSGKTPGRPVACRDRQRIHDDAIAVEPIDPLDVARRVTAAPLPDAGAPRSDVPR